MSYLGQAPDSEWRTWVATPAQRDALRRASVAEAHAVMRRRRGLGQTDPTPPPMRPLNWPVILGWIGLVGASLAILNGAVTLRANRKHARRNSRHKRRSTRRALRANGGLEHFEFSADPSGRAFVIRIEARDMFDAVDKLKKELKELDYDTAAQMAGWPVKLSAYHLLRTGGMRHNPGVGTQDWYRSGGLYRQGNWAWDAPGVEAHGDLLWWNATLRQFSPVADNVTIDEANKAISKSPLWTWDAPAVTRNRRRRMTSNPRYKMWTGPMYPRQVADAVRKAGGHDVIAGTEHVIFRTDDFDALKARAGIAKPFLSFRGTQTIRANGRRSRG